MSDEISADTIDVEIGGETVSLVPTLGAGLALSKQFGGLSEAYARLGRLDVEAIIAVIRAGSGRKDAEFGGAAFAAGLSILATKAAEYLSLLLSGGKKVETAAGETDDAGNA